MSDNQLKIIVKDLVLSTVSTPVRVGLYGSRAKGGSPGKWSDIDVVVAGNEPLGGDRISDLREAFEESDLPYFTDVTDLLSAKGRFKKQLLKEVEWL